MFSLACNVYKSPNLYTSFPKQQYSKKILLFLCYENQNPSPSPDGSGILYLLFIKLQKLKAKKDRTDSGTKPLKNSQ